MVNKEPNYTLYTVLGILGIVAIVAIVGLILIVDNKKATALVDDLGNVILLTAASVQSGKEDCLSLSDRPCYMRGAKAPTYWVHVGETGADNSYTKCLQNPNLVGEALFYTDFCGEGKREKVHFCYQGRGFPIYYLNGECVVPPWLATG